MSLGVTALGSAAGATETRRIDTLAGGPGEGPARQVGQEPLFVRADGQSLLVADGAHQVLRRIDLATQQESVVAGMGGEYLIAQPGRPPLVTPDDGGPAIKAAFHRLGAFATAPDGTIYLADERRIRKISPDGVITTAVGTGARRASAQPAEARVEDLPLAPVTGMAVDRQGRLWFAEDGIDASGGTIRRLDPDGVARLIIGYGTQSLDGAPGRQYLLQQPTGMFFDSDGALVFANDREFSTIVLRYVSDHVQHGHSVDLDVNDMTPAGNGDLLLAAGALFRLRPDGTTVREPGTGQVGVLGVHGHYASVSMLPNGRPVMARDRDYFVTTIDDAGGEVALAGDGSAGAAGDDGPATGSQLGKPTSISRTPDGSIVIADETANRVRRVLPDGRMTTLIGTGAAINTGDGGPAAQAAIRMPSVVEAGPDGSVYVAALDPFNAFLIRKITPLGTVSTYAGGGNAIEPTADAREQSLGGVEAMDVGQDGSLYVNRHCQILKIAPGPTAANGGVTTIYAGGGPCGYSGDGGDARSALFGEPRGLALSSLGDLYVSDGSADRVRRIDAAGTVHPFAGRGYRRGSDPSFAGDGGPASEAHLRYPGGLAVTADGSVLIADQHNYRVRQVSPDGTINTVAGGRYEGPLGDGGAADKASLNAPRDVESGGDGEVYIAEPGSPSILYNYGHHRVRVVTTTATASPAPTNQVPAVSVNPFVVRFGQPAYVTISGTPGATVDLFTRKYRADFIKIRSGLVLNERGQATVETRPDMNLRFMAKDRTVFQGSSIGGTSGLMTVEKQVSINVKRIGVNRFTFSGSINPGHPGAVVHLYRNGNLIKSNIPVSSSRVYSVTATLPTGTANYRISSPATGYNNLSHSPVRSVRIY